jgi:tetratricopeptide (TPR) repeat protein
MARFVWLLLLLQPVHAEWIRLRAPQVEILTDANEKSARRLLARISTVRQVAGGTRADDSPPVRIFLFSSEREFRAYADGAATQGFYQSGPERDYIVLHTGVGLTRAAAHEYVHLILNHSAARFPHWLDEGMAEFYSTLDVSGASVTIGQPIEEHLRTLKNVRLLNAAELEAAGRSSRTYDEQSLAGTFYAESWALAHLLNLAPAWRAGMPRFIELLLSGRAASDVFQEAFGRSLDQAIDAIPGHVAMIRSVSLDAPPLKNDSASTDRLTTLSATLLRADLALHAKKLDLARGLFERAARTNPDSPEAEAGLGTLAMAQSRPSEARDHLQRAIQLRAPGGEIFFELAMLDRDSGISDVDDLLQRAIAVNPSYAEAHLLLGLRATDRNEFPEAIGHLELAARFLPRQSYIWNELAYAQMKAGKLEAARDSALRAFQTAQSTDHASRASTLLEALKSGYVSK